MINLYNVDCNIFMKDIPDNYYDLAIVDPEYRDKNQPTKDMRKNGGMENWRGKPSKQYFDELLRISKNQIIWGANNFQLPPFKGFIVWKKLTISESFTMSMAEIAALSEGLSTVSKIIELAPQGAKEDPRITPTQKPVKLYQWILDKYAKPGWKIFDSHGGSMSIAKACHNLGFDLDICEIDIDTFEKAKKRLEWHKKQLRIF